VRPLFTLGEAMHILYADESGSIDDPNQRFFVLAGVAVFERRTHWIDGHLLDIAKRFDPVDPQRIELHGSPMRSGRDEWKGVDPGARIQAIRDALRHGIVDENRRDGVRLFAAVIEKASVTDGDVAEVAFTQLASRFDQFLMRLYRSTGEGHRGLIVFDRSSTEQRIQTMARDFKYNGHRWGQLRNLAEVPLFIDSKATRLIQLADLVAWSIYRNYEANDPMFFNDIAHCFDTDAGVRHGLYVQRIRP
jgi:hypothetical protein